MRRPSAARPSNWGGEFLRGAMPRGQSPTDRFAIKPNITATLGKGRDFAIITDPDVVEGLISGTAPGGRERRQHLRPRCAECGSAGRGLSGNVAALPACITATAIRRSPLPRECPDGVVFRRTKYLGPFNYPDTHLINVAKLKSHSMGLTLCMKNLQGPTLSLHSILRRPAEGDCAGFPARRPKAMWTTFRTSTSRPGIRAGTRPRPVGWRCGFSAPSIPIRCCARPFC